MDWNDVRVFRAVALARSLAQGARQLDLDRSTASRRISALEDELGARLFLRTRAGLRPSPAGERLLIHAERMATEARALEAAAHDEGARVSGLVRIASTEALATMLVRDGLLRLRAHHPDLELELLGGNRAVDLARGEADLALRLSAATAPSLRARRLARLPFALFASPAYLERRGRPADELAGHDAIGFAGDLAALPEARWLAARPGLRIVLRSSSIPALIAAIVDGHGLGVLPRATGDLEPGLVRLRDLPAIAPRTLWLVMHPDAAARAAVKVVADHVAAIVKQRA
ncbi:MAG: LysR family transcriptional regulator [Deltaproteobacteria bacterium]|nr:LysR family transcriptional regulator [Deltaproteobacteria bacterium]